MNKDCVLNPVSGRAVKITSRIGKKIMKENSNPQHDCLINPKTGRAVKRTTKLGKEILKRLEESPAENTPPVTILANDIDVNILPINNTLENRLKIYNKAKIYLDKIDEKECLKNINIMGKNYMSLSNKLILDKQIGSRSVYGTIYLSKIINVPELLVVSKVTNKNKKNLNEIVLMEILTNDLVKTKKTKHFPLIYTSHLCEDKDDKNSLVSVNELCDGDLKSLLNTSDLYLDKRFEELYFNLLIQIFISLATFQFKFNMIHNDAHYGNFLYQKNNEKGYYKYEISRTNFYLKSCPYNIMLYDFGLAKDVTHRSVYFEDYYRIIHAFVPEIYGGWNEYLTDIDIASKMVAIKEELGKLNGTNARFSFADLLNIVLQYAPKNVYKNNASQIINNKSFFINKNI